MLMLILKVVIQKEACYKIGKSDWRTASKKTIAHFINRKYCKKASHTKKKKLCNHKYYN